MENNMITYYSWATAHDSYGYKSKIYLTAVYNLVSNLLLVNPIFETKNSSKLNNEDYRKIYEHFDNFITNCELCWEEPHEDLELRSPFNDNTDITQETFKDAAYWCFVKLTNPEQDLKDIVDQLCLEIMCHL